MSTSQVPCTSNNDCSGPSSTLARPYNVYCDTASSLCHEELLNGATCTSVRVLALCMLQRRGVRWVPSFQTCKSEAPVLALLGPMRAAG